MSRAAARAPAVSPALSLVAALLAALLAGCGSDGGDEACPPGQVPAADGGCRPLFPDVPSGGDDAAAPADTADGADTAPSDVASPPDAARDARADGGGADEVGGADTPVEPDVPAATGAVGDPCRRDRDCQDGFVCLSMGTASGSCTLLGCDAAAVECPAGSVCLRFEAGASACFATCETAADCRIASHACKTLADDAGERADVCHEVRDDAGGPGAPCADDAACAGHLACLRSLPGGACLSLFCASDADCGDEGFPGGGACVPFDGVETCLARCAEDGDCVGYGDGSLTCETRRNTGGQSLPVCVSGAAGLVIGAACLSDGECESGVCETLGDGRCTVDDLPCFGQADCPAASTCVPIDPPVSACSAPCGSSTRCTTGGACVLEDDGASACRPACRWDAGHTSHDCRPETGWGCVYGVPLADESRKGYHCAPTATGRIGAVCEDDDGCADPLATCLRPTDRPDAATGYCSRACSPQQPCPFGTWCLPHGAAWRCQRVCFSALDCGEGDVCRPGAPYDTCAPE